MRSETTEEPALQSYSHVQKLACPIPDGVHAGGVRNGSDRPVLELMQLGVLQLVHAILHFHCFDLAVAILRDANHASDGFVRLTLRAAQSRDAHSTIPLPSASLSA